MAAFLGLNLNRLGLVEGAWDGAGAALNAGFGFWASVSVTLMLLFLSLVAAMRLPRCSVSRGGRVSWTSGLPPVMEVSGMPEPLGGASGGCRWWGWYALAVCRWRVCLADDMERKHWGELLEAESDVEVAKRNSDGAAATALAAERENGMAVVCGSDTGGGW